VPERNGFKKNAGMGYVCAFRGRRDGYQVPIALAEAGQLDAFITDHFSGPMGQKIAPLLPPRLGERIVRRYDERIPQDNIKRLTGTALAEALWRFVKLPPMKLFERFDPSYGNAAARLARLRKSHLFLYSSYAWEAFNAEYSHNPKKILFQFHPHFEAENGILAEDIRASAALNIVFSGRMESGAAPPDNARRRSDAAWRLAGHIVCASSFTKRSLERAGADPARISVIPYGASVPLAAAPPRRDAGQRFHAIFVGSGLQRKGLHHLLLAWRVARLPPGSRLTVVSRTVDPALVPLLHETGGVEFLPGVSTAELGNLYGGASLFVMPSLVEGFGQVYLEALSHGLPVLGTRNTCLPDLGGEADGVFLTAPGDINALAERLRSLAGVVENNPDLRRRAKECASRWTWERFRASLRAML
jgi:glycosyltransferase involved in cell wall biosynthesis